MPKLSLNEIGFKVQLDGADECINTFKTLNELLKEAKNLVADLEDKISRLSAEITGGE